MQYATLLVISLCAIALAEPIEWGHGFKVNDEAYLTNVIKKDEHRVRNSTAIGRGFTLRVTRDVSAVDINTVIESLAPGCAVTLPRNPTVIDYIMLLIHNIDCRPLVDIDQFCNFHLAQPDIVSAYWGILKNARIQSYDIFSRSLRYLISNDQLSKAPGNYKYHFTQPTLDLYQTNCHDLHQASQRNTIIKHT